MMDKLHTFRITESSLCDLLEAIDWARSILRMPENALEMDIETRNKSDRELHRFSNIAVQKMSENGL
jgi:hypothetical protein